MKTGHRSGGKRGAAKYEAINREMKTPDNIVQVLAAEVITSCRYTNPRMPGRLQSVCWSAMKAKASKSDSRARAAADQPLWTVCTVPSPEEACDK